MGVRGSRAGSVRDGVELGAWQQGAGIVVLLGIAALVLFGCGDGRLAEVNGRPKATPTPLDFGAVAVGAHSQARLEVHNDGVAPFVIVGFEPGDRLPKEFKLPQEAIGKTVPSGGRLEVAFGFEPSAEALYEGEAVLLTDSATAPRIDIPMLGKGARPTVQCSRRLDFGRVVLNQPTFLAMTCMNQAELPAVVKVRAVEGRDAALFEVGTNLPGTQEFTIPARGNQRLEVMYSAGYLGEAEAEAVLEVPGAEEPTLRIPMTGEAFATDFYAVPGVLEFDSVSPGATRTLPVRLVNDGTHEVVLRDVTLTDPDRVFAASTGTNLGIAVPARSEIEVPVTFAPRSLVAYAGTLTVTSTDPTNPRLQVQLKGRGGGARMLVTPDRVDFGSVATNMVVGRQVMIANVGTDDGEPLIVSSLDVEGDPASFSVDALPAPVEILPGDPPLAVAVRFRPLSEGAFSASLKITSNDAASPELLVPLTGEARELPPCQYVVEPAAISFGAVSVGAKGKLSARLRNVGTDECVFTSVAPTAGTSDVFSMTGGSIASATVAAGASLELEVALDARRAGDHRGSISYFVSDPGAPQGSIPLTALVATGCLTADPPAIDFGAQRLVCPAVARQITLTNSCAGDITVTDLSFGAGTASAGELVVSGTTPSTLRGGTSTTVVVRYDPAAEGLDSAPLLVSATGLSQPLAIPVSGRGTRSATRTDRFQQHPRQAVDVLFVIDNSGSMMEEQQAIADAFDSFIGFARQQQIDYHLGVTTTGISRANGGWQACPGGVDGGEAGRLFPADGGSPRWVTPSTPDAAAVFRNNVNVGICHWWEEGLEAAYAALSTPLVDSPDDPRPTQKNVYVSMPNDGNLGFYRSDAKLSVIIVSDEDDHSPRPTSFYARFFNELKGPGREDLVTVHGVLGDGCSTASEAGARYGEVVRATGGVVESICTNDWKDLLASLSEHTFGFSRRFSLSGTPEGSVEVRVDGAPASGWTYDPRSNAVVFEEDATPKAGSTVDVTYTPACGT